MNDRCRTAWVCFFVWVFVGASVPGEAATPTTNPAGHRGSLRLDGTFIQYQTWMMTMDADAWRRELQAMQRAGLRTIIIAALQSDNTSFIPTDDNTPDPTKIILEYADAHGMEVWLGLAMSNAWWTGAHDPELLGKMADQSIEVAARAWSRYGKHKSLFGWYIPQEPWDNFDPKVVPIIRTFLRRISDECKRLSANKPIGLAPFLTGNVGAVALGEKFTALLTDSGIDVVMLQDSVGARRWDDDVYRIRPFFRAMRDACLAAGAELWCDVEVFRLEQVDRDGKKSDKFFPSDVRRLARQLTAVAPFVTKLVAFDCFHYMSPYRGEAQKKFHEAYLSDFVDRPFWPVYGPSVTVDPNFRYYLDRSAESIAAEIKANGYSIVHYIADPANNVRPEIIKALHDAGIGVWYMAFAHTTYRPDRLPKQWIKWRMVSRNDLMGAKPAGGFEHLCPNNADYRRWKKLDMAAALVAAPFDAIEIVEAHWPEYPGTASPGYSCFCEACRQAFNKMFPEDSALPDIIKADSPASPGKNPELWTKWLKFREASMTEFLDNLVNGVGGLRESSPHVPVCVWGYGLAEEDAVKRVLRDSGMDAGNVASRVRPDAYCIQTHWPDWMRADLPADYVKHYKPFFDQVRRVSPKMPLMVQADIGSTREAVRDRVWTDEFEKTCRSEGVESTTLYEYFIAGWTYREPPCVTSVARKGRWIELCFTRRIDPASAQKLGAITLRPGHIQQIQVDGNVVRVLVEGAVLPGMEITVNGIVTDSKTCLFADIALAPPLKQQVRLPR